MKANKNSVATALHKKANKTDLTEAETLLKTTIEELAARANQNLKDANDCLAKKIEKKITSHKDYITKFESKIDQKLK